MLRQPARLGEFFNSTNMPEGLHSCAVEFLKKEAVQVKVFEMIPIYCAVKRYGPLWSDFQVCCIGPMTGKNASHGDGH